MENIINKIQQAFDNGMTAFGVRAMTPNPVEAAEFTLVEGAELEASYIWEDGVSTDEELGGVSTIGFTVDQIDGEVSPEEIKAAIEKLSIYDSEQIVIVGGHQNIDALHNDDGEIVIADAVIVAVL